MPYFGKTSKRKLATCHQKLQDLFNEVIKVSNCSITDGHREEERQNLYYAQGKSRVKWPNSKHNKPASLAVDAPPYVNGKISWDIRHCIYHAGVVLGIAARMGIVIRWGGNWDMDEEVMTDQDFQDLVHFELINETGGETNE